MWAKNPQVLPLWVSLTPSLLAGAVAIFAPHDTLDRLPVLQGPVQLMTRLIPAMPGYLTLSHFPQVTAVTFLVAWVLLPFQLGYSLHWALRRWDKDRLIAVIRQRGWGRKTGIGLSLCVLALTAGGVAFLPKDAWFVESFGVANSRLALAVVGAWAFWWMCVALSFLSVLLLKTSKGDFEE